MGSLPCQRSTSPYLEKPRVFGGAGFAAEYVVCLRLFDLFVKQAKTEIKVFENMRSASSYLMMKLSYN